MFLAMLFLAVLLLGVAAATITSAVLTFTPMRHSWRVLVCVLPGFAIGAFYSVGFLLARRPFSPWFVLFWLLFVLGAFVVVRWFYRRP